MNAKRIGCATLVLALLCGGAGKAVASITLLQLTDAPGQTDTAYALPFLATAATTTVEFAGYQVPLQESVGSISLTPTAGGSDLLGSSWTFTPALSGSGANQSIGILFFYGQTVGSYDTFSQTVPTTVGASYSLSFQYTNTDSPFNAPSGFIVSSSGAATPEPASLAIWGLAMAGILAVARRCRA